MGQFHQSEEMKWMWMIHEQVHSLPGYSTGLFRDWITAGFSPCDGSPGVIPKRYDPSATLYTIWL